jgi:PIN domain nuclease of toxin-antitoxin system
MRVLLDTHAFIWWDDEQAKLSPTAINICKDPENTLLLSLVSVWEMQIKIQLGKLTFSVSLADKIKNQQQTNGLELFPITLQDTFVTITRSSII